MAGKIVNRQALLDSICALPSENLTLPKVIWVESPPGFGKSTLLQSVKEESPNTISYTFRPHDNGNFDLYRSLAECIASTTLNDALKALILSEHPTNQQLASEFCSLFCSQLVSPSFLLLDDYHHIAANDELNYFLMALIQLLPTGCKVVFASRVAPHPSFERLRFNQQLLPITVDQLTFNEQEVAQLMALYYQNDTDYTTPPSSGHDTAANLYQHTQGWPAAVLLYIQGLLHNPGEPLEKIAQSLAQSIHNYYLSEIRPNIKIEIFKPLAETSSFTPELAAAICGVSIEAMENILAELEYSRFFVYKTGISDHHYSFHSVIRSALNTHKTLNLTAEQHQDYRIACSWDELADLITEQAEDFIHHGLEDALDEWLNFIPSSIYNNHIWLRYWRARMLSTRQPRKARIVFSELFFEMESDKETEIQLVLWSSIIETYIIELSEFRSVTPWIEKLTELESKIDRYPSIESEAEVLTGLNSVFQWVPPQDYDIEKLFSRTERILYELEDPKLKIRLACAYIRHLVNQGSYYRSLAVMGIIRENFNQQSLSPSDSVLLHYSRLIGNYIAGLQTTDEHLALKQAQSEAQSMGMTIIDISVRYTLILAYLEHNQLEMAKLKITDAKKRLDMGFALDDAHLEFVSGWLALIEGDYGRAREHQLKSHKHSMATGELCSMYTLAHLSIIEIDCGNHEKASEYLNALHQLAYEKNAGIAKLHYHYVKAYYLLSIDQLELGLEHVKVFFNRCRENAIFTFAGRVHHVMVLLFELAIENEIEPLFTKKMIAFQGVHPLVFGNITSAWPHQIKISTLGTVDIEVGPDKLIGTKKPSKIELRLIKLLISNEGRPMDITTIEEIIWPDQDTLVPGSNFKSTVSRVRKRLGSKDVIVVKDHRAHLNKEVIWVDCWGLTECLDRLNSQRTRLSSIEYRRYCDAFIKLYRGDFYLDYDSELWLAQYQYEIQSKYIQFMSIAAEWFYSKNSSANNVDLRTKVIYQLNYVYSRTLRSLIRSGNIQEANKRQAERQKVFSKINAPILDIPLAAH